MPLIPDVSVAVKWFIAEVHSEAARRARYATPPLHVPEFFTLEFSSVACKKQRRGELSVQEVLQMIQAIRVVPIQRHPDSELLPGAIEIALDTSLSVYDSMYISLAVELEVPFVTADRRLINAVESSRYSSRVLWAEDLPAV